MTDTAVEAEHLQIVRGGRVVLPDLALSVRRGVVTGLLGPSGSGKTTLMRAIVGVQRVTAGSVIVLGRPAGSAELRRRVAYVTQAPSLYDDLTVEENLRYFARMTGAPAARIEVVVEEVGLGEQVDQLVGRLSGGELSRVSLASALLAEPEVLVLDEPTVGLDPVLRRDLWATFARLAALGTTLLVSSHVMDEAARCDALLLLREGRLAFSGRPDELRAQTATDDLGEAFLRLIEADQIGAP